MKIIIADDSLLLRERLKERLNEISGVDILALAKDGIQAIESIRKLQPDVVILDIRMPNENGIEVLQTIKRDNNSPIIIMFTNFPLPQYREKCKKAGADYFFDKSSEYQELADALQYIGLETNPAEITK